MPRRDENEMLEAMRKGRKREERASRKGDTELIHRREMSGQGRRKREERES